VPGATRGIDVTLRRPWNLSWVGERSLTHFCRRSALIGRGLGHHKAQIQWPGTGLWDRSLHSGAGYAKTPTIRGS